MLLAMVCRADDWGMFSYFPSEDLRPLLQSQLKKIAQHANRIVIFGGLPKPVGNFAAEAKGETHFLDKMVVNVWRKWKQFAPLALFRELEPERRLRVEEDLRWAAETVPNVSFLPIAPHFKEAVEWLDDGVEYVRLVDPYTGRLGYMDQMHLNYDGVRSLEGAFRKGIFEEPACNAPLDAGEGAAATLAE